MPLTKLFIVQLFLGEIGSNADVMAWSLLRPLITAHTDIEGQTDPEHRQSVRWLSNGMQIISQGGYATLISSDKTALAHLVKALNLKVKSTMEERVLLLAPNYKGFTFGEQWESVGWKCEYQEDDEHSRCGQITFTLRLTTEEVLRIKAVHPDAIAGDAQPNGPKAANFIFAEKLGIPRCAPHLALQPNEPAAFPYYLIPDDERSSHYIEECLNSEVQKLEMSTRLARALKNNGIRSIRDVVEYMSEYKMLINKNFGKKSLRELKQMLAVLGLRLRQY